MNKNFTDAELVEVLQDLDSVGRSVDAYEYGLPIYSGYEEELIDVLRKFLDKKFVGHRMSPDHMGYANLGTGMYVINHTPKNNTASLIISIASEEEKAGREVGECRVNPEGYMLQPEVMAVRIDFQTVQALNALEHQLSMLRIEHFPESI